MAIGEPYDRRGMTPAICQLFEQLHHFATCYAYWSFWVPPKRERARFKRNADAYRRKVRRAVRGLVEQGYCAQVKKELRGMIQADRNRKRNIKSMKKRWKENLHDRTPRQLTRHDTVYGMRMISGFQHFFFGKFVALQRGAISIKGVWIEPEHRALQLDNVECVETFRVDKCLLWGKGADDDWPRCHWFSRGKDYPAS